MALRVLCIDDDRRLYELLASYLAPNGVTLVHATDGAKGLAALERDVFDAVLLDVMMPGMDGLEVCRRIRQTEPGSDHHADRARRRGRSGGRARAGRRRLRPEAVLAARAAGAAARGAAARAAVGASTPRSSSGRVAIDVGARRVRVGGEPAELTGLEFDILLALARRPGRVVPRETLLAEAGRNDVTVNDRTVDVHVSHLRRSWATIRRRRASSRRCAASATCWRRTRRPAQAQAGDDA